MGAGKTLNALAFEAGKTFAFGGTMMANVDTKFKLSMSYNLPTETDTQYATIATANGKAGEWTVLENTAFTIPANASSLLLYFETDSEEEGGSLTDFFVDEAYGGNEGCKSPVAQFVKEPEPTTTEPTTTSTTPEPTTESTTESTTTSTTPEPTTESTTESTTTSTTSEPTTTSETPQPTQPTEPAGEAVYGDIDDNEIVNVNDLVLLCKAVASQSGASGYSGLSVGGLRNSDVYADGKVDINDIVVLVNYYLDKIPSLPVYINS
jgi:hypothetical protein